MTLNIENEYKESAGNAGFLSDEELYEIALNVIKSAVEFENFPYEAEVSVLITTDEEIMMLNNEFRGLDKSTDVLSFPMADFDGPGAYEELSVIDELFNPDTGDFVLGDIVISADHCIAQALEYGHSVKREYAFLLTHSMLHLLGYDHTDDIESAIMQAHEDGILDLAGISR